MTYRQLMDQIASDKVMLALTAGKPTHHEITASLHKETPYSLFAGSYSPEGAMCGVWLHYGHWDKAHNIAQDLRTPEGSYWHGIVHRLEPDAWNSKYWFGQVGKHKIFPALQAAASRLAIAKPAAGFEPGSEWKPGEFVEFCERARQGHGSEAEVLAREIQMAEWWLLFEYCVRRGF